jgi:cytidylate kinase
MAIKIRKPDYVPGTYARKRPGAAQLVELSAMLFGEKSFTMSDYLKRFISVVYALADMGSIIFVGRGTHLILPRDRVLAVRFICAKEYRIKRLAEIVHLQENEAAKLIVQIDREQRGFFKKVFGQKQASPYEFDMVINCDHIPDPRHAATIVARAFAKKFGSELNSQKKATSPSSRRSQYESV